MKYKLNNYEKVFLILSVLNTIVVCFLGLSYLTYGILAYLLFMRFAKKITNDNLLLFALFIPNKYLQLAVMPIYIMLCLSKKRKKLKSIELLFLAYITFVGLINCIFYCTMPLGTVFQVAVYYCIFKIIALYGNKFDYSNVLLILDEMLKVQVLSCLIEILKYRAIGDPVTGTLISAHYLGVYLIVYIILLLRMKPSWMKKSEMIIKTIVAIVFIYLSDAKHVWIVFVFSFFVSWIIKKLHVKKKILFSVLAMTLIVVGGTMFLASNYGQNFISSLQFTQKTYILNEQYNKKFVFFHRTFEQMVSLNGLFGFGVGQFGSQISLTLSKGIIYKWDAHLAAYHYAIEPYANAIDGLMTEWYSKDGIPISSMVLGYPLVSFSALFAELGIIGFVWLLIIFDSRFKEDNPSFIIAFFILTIFDTYFEIPCVLILVIVATYANEYCKRNVKRHVGDNS